MILILTNKWDITADFVVRELRRRKLPYLRLNTEDLNSAVATVHLPEFEFVLSTDKGFFNLGNEVSAVWCRRPGKLYDNLTEHERPTVGTQRFIWDQWYAWIEALQLLPDVTWINPSQASSAFENKVRQLVLAQRIGFRVPHTLVTNDCKAVNGMDSIKRGLVGKALYSPLIEEADQDYFVFTSEVVLPLRDDGSIKICPSIFQERLTPKTDYRVTVIGDTVLAARIEEQSSDSIPLDWRTSKAPVKFVPCDLPVNVTELCQTFIREAGLVFGAIDLVECDGDFHFLEINPNGEWGWLQKTAGLPIAEALCNVLELAERARTEYVPPASI